MNKSKLTPEEFGRIIQDMYTLAHSSENHTWFLERDDFEDGTYTKSDYSRFMEDIALMKYKGIEDIDSVVEYSNLSDNYDPVAIFYGEFLNLFDEPKQNKELATRLILFYKEYDPYDYQNNLELSQDDNDMIELASYDLNDPTYVKSVIDFLKSIDLEDLDNDLIIKKNDILDELYQIERNNSKRNTTYEHDDYEIEM